jgi:hypothetical protein
MTLMDTGNNNSGEPNRQSSETNITQENSVVKSPTSRDPAVLAGLNEVAAWFIGNYYVRATSSKGFLMFEEGAWRPRSPDYLKSLIVDRMPSRHEHRLGEVLEIVAARTHIEPEELKSAYCFDGEGGLLLNCANGLLWLPEGEEEWQLGEHNKDWLFTQTLAANYDPKAKCGIYERVLPEIVPQEEDQELILDFGAYLLIPRCNLEKIMNFYGDGENGKSTIVVGYTAPIGEGLLQHYTMDTLTNDKLYGLGDLRLSLLNIAGEMSDRIIKDSSMVKALASGEVVATREPYAQHRKMATTCKQLFLENNIPHIEKGTRADLRRLAFVLFDQHFTEKSRKTNLKAEIKKEADGLLLRLLGRVPAMLKAESLREGGLGSRLLTQRAQTRIDPLGEFVRQCCLIGGERKDGEKWESNELLNKAWQLFLGDAGIPHFGSGDAWFGRLRDHYPTVVKYRAWHSDPKQRPRGHKGIVLTEKWQKRAAAATKNRGKGDKIW